MQFLFAISVSDVLYVEGHCFPLVRDEGSETQEIEVTDPILSQSKEQNQAENLSLLRANLKRHFTFNWNKFLP